MFLGCRFFNGNRFTAPVFRLLNRFGFCHCSQLVWELPQPCQQSDTLVDLINLVSLRTGHSIGGFDADEIQGTDLELGIGRAEELFEGIGRGMLNIEGLPVYRDRIGGIGTPTSDHERTKMKLETRHILAIVNGYNGQEGLKEAAEMILELLEKYASSTSGTIQYFE